MESVILPILIIVLSVVLDFNLLAAHTARNATLDVFNAKMETVPLVKMDISLLKRKLEQLFVVSFVNFHAKYAGNNHACHVQLVIP